MSDLSQLAYATTAEVAAMIQRKEVSSREAVDFFLDRVEALDKAINSVVTIDAERARAEADAADTELAGGTSRGPLHDDQGFVSNQRHADDVGCAGTHGLHSRGGRLASGPTARSRGYYLR